MRLLYATSILFPSPLANRVQIVEMSKAFHALLQDNFLLGIGLIKKGTLPVPYVEMGKNIRSYKLAWRYLALARQKEITHIFCREEKLLFFMQVYKTLFPWRFPQHFVFEVHHLEHKRALWFSWLIPRIPSIISITENTKRMLTEANVSGSNILVEPDAVDVGFFEVAESKEQARKKVQLPLDKKIVMYTGAVDPWKGVDTLYEAAALLPDEYCVYVVGARASHIADFNARHALRNNFVTVGYVEHDLIPLYLAAADSVIIPNSGKSDISRYHTSPMKAFEYMAARRPIVASYLPSIREVLGEESGERAVYVTPDDPKSLAEGIITLMNSSELQNTITKNAYEYVKGFTWDRRARNILDFTKHE